MTCFNRSPAQRVRLARVVLCVLGLVATSGSAVRAQTDSSVVKLVTATLQPTDAQNILAVLADVEARHLPASLLTAKVREGISKKASGPLILQIVRTYAKLLGDARDALGPNATATEVEAATFALRSGLRANMLRDMRTARPSQSISTPLIVAGDLVQRGVPIDSVSAGIVSLLGGGATDAEFQQLQLQVARSMLNGSSPLPAYRSFLALPRSGGTATGPKRPPPPVDRPPLDESIARIP